MATGNDLIYCPICLDVLITPRALPCLHTFCELCLHEYIQATVAGNRAVTGFDCPTCRRMVPAPSSSPCDKWAGQFVLNYMIVTLIDEKKAGNTNTRSIPYEKVKLSPFEPTRADKTPIIEDPIKPPYKHNPDEEEAPVTEMSGQYGDGPQHHFPLCCRGPRGRCNNSHKHRRWPRCGPPPHRGPPPFGPPPHEGPPPFGPHEGPPPHRGPRHPHRPHSERPHRGHCHRPPHI